MVVGIADRRRSRAAHLGPERRRPVVLDTALEIAIEGGVAAVSIGSVADRMTVTRPVVYSCFADRGALIVALLEREEDRLLDAVLRTLPRGRGGDDPQTVFVEGFQSLLETVSERPDSWRLVFDASPDPAVAHHFGRARTVVGERFAQLIRPTLERWGTTDVERKLPVLVELFMSSGEGAVRSLLAEGSDWDPLELGAFIGSAVFRAFELA
jgi:AcrR family transcriptional regulator